MKKKLLAFVMVYAGMAAFLMGCGERVNDNGIHAPESEADTEETFADFIEEEIEENTPDVDKVYGETRHNEELARFLGEYFDIPEEYRSESRYYYNYVDLDEDGKSEILALVVGDYTSDSGGETVLLLTEKQKEFQVIESFSMVRTPIIIADTETLGWRDLIFSVYGGGAEPGYLYCKYAKDGGYDIQQAFFMEKLDKSVAGTQVLSNNLIDDEDKGNFLPLAP